jgi:hypothetical protein
MIGVTIGLFEFREFEDIPIKLAAKIGIDAAQPKMADAALAVLDFIGIRPVRWSYSIVTSRHIAVEIVHADAGKGVAGPVQHLNLGYFSRAGKTTSTSSTSNPK